MDDSGQPKGAKGFAAMDKAKQRAVASAGGKAAHAAGRAHQFTEQEARAAGAKGRAARLAMSEKDPSKTRGQE